ncbi:MAG: hypothetical protein J7521_12595 [Caulobacter sp.]|nr:hypothetical protein [Caulobacter sp.]
MLPLVFAVALNTTTPAPKPSATPGLSAALKADQKLGCAVLFAGADEVVRRNPSLIARLSEGNDGGAAIGPLLKMLGATSDTILNQALAEAAARGERPADTYRRGVASLASLIIEAVPAKTGDKVAKDGEDDNEQRGMAMFTGCLSVMTE